MDLNLRHTDSLVDEARTGNRRALTDLWDQWKPLAYKNAARYLKDQDDLDQAVSQGLTKAFMNLDKWSGTGPFAAWLSRIVRNETVNWIRQFKTKVKTFSDIEGVDVVTEDVHADRPALNLIREIVNQLPTRQQLAFKLVVYEDLSYEQAAVHMGTTAGAVKSNVHDAKTKLRKQLSRTGLR
jgi:RNA polymerase sigma-70 factor (ECF subfamily)